MEIHKAHPALPSFPKVLTPYREFNAFLPEPNAERPHETVASFIYRFCLHRET